MGQNTAVITAHPGHELRILQWIMNVKPDVYILTDGSGSKGVSRIDESLSVINNANASKSEFFSLRSDKQFYNEILNKNTGFFVDLAEKIYFDISDKKIDLIAGDANKGFNTMHDIYRNIINAIVIKSKKRLDKEIMNLCWRILMHAPLVTMMRSFIICPSRKLKQKFKLLKVSIH